MAAIDHAQFKAACAHAGHRPRLRHVEAFATLKSPEKKARFDSRFRRERRCADRAFQPHQRANLIRCDDMSEST